MRYGRQDFERAACFVQQFAEEDKSGQMDKIAEMLRHAGGMTVYVSTAKQLLEAIDASPKGENKDV